MSTGVIPGDGTVRRGKSRNTNAGTLVRTGVAPLMESDLPAPDTHSGAGKSCGEGVCAATCEPGA